MNIYVVCDKSGNCHGIFQNYELANNLAELIDANISDWPLKTNEEEWRLQYRLQTTGKIDQCIQQ